MRKIQGLRQSSEPHEGSPVAHNGKMMAGKKWSVLSGAIVFVGLVIAAAAVVVPKIIHANQVSQYTQLLAETNEALVSMTSDQASEQAASELLQLQGDGARKYAEQLTALGATAAPILTADVTAGIKKAAEELTKDLGEAPKPEVESAKLPLSIAYQEQIAADKVTADEAVAEITAKQKTDLEKAKDDAAKTKINDAAAKAIEEARAEQITPNVLDLTVEQSVELLELDPSVATLRAVEDEKVNGDVLDRAKRDRDGTVSLADKQAKKLDAVQKQIDGIHSKLDGTVQPLLAAANEAPTQVKEVIAAAPKSGADKQTDATNKADAAQDAIEGNAEKREAEDKKPEDKAKTSDDEKEAEDAKVAAELATKQSPAVVLSLVNGYVTAAKAVSDHHSAVVAEEAAAAAAAEAAASGAGGYTDPSTGDWVSTGGGGGWSGGGSGGGGWSGGGGGNSGGGGGNSGGGSGGGNAGTPESWFAANCPHGYNWWWSPSDGGQGYCFNAPEIGGDW